MNRSLKLETIFFTFFFSFFFMLNVEASGLGSKRYRDRFAKVPPAPEREEPVGKGKENEKDDRGTKGGKTGKKKKKDIAIPAWAKGTDTSAITVDAESGQLTSLSHNGFSEPGAPVIWGPDSFELIFPGRGLHEYVREKFAEEAAMVFLDENGLSLWPSDLQIRHLAEMGKGPFLPVSDNPAGITGFNPFSSFGRSSEEFKRRPGLAQPLTLDEVDLSGIIYRVNGPFEIAGMTVTIEEVHEILDKIILNLINSKSPDVRDLVLVLGRQKEFKTVIEVDNYDFNDFTRFTQIVGIGESFTLARTGFLTTYLGIKGTLIELPITTLTEQGGITNIFRFGDIEYDLESTLLHELVHARQYYELAHIDVRGREGGPFLDRLWYRRLIIRGHVIRAKFFSEKEMEYLARSYENLHNQLNPERKYKFPIRTHYGDWELPYWAQTYPFKRGEPRHEDQPGLVK